MGYFVGLCMGLVWGVWFSFIYVNNNTVSVGEVQYSSNVECVKATGSDCNDKWAVVYVKAK